MKRNPDLTPNPRIALYYLVVAGILFPLAFFAGFWGLPLAWVALSMFAVAGGYLWWGAAVYGKRQGRIAFLPGILMAPMRLGQYLSLLVYRRQCRPWDEVAPGVWIGSVLTRKEAERLVEEGMDCVLDLTAEFSETPGLRKLRYLNLPVLDLTAPTSEYLKEAVRYIRDCLRTGGSVFVHCKIGYSRSAAAVGAYFLAEGTCSTAEEAADRLRDVRPTIVIRPEVMEAMRGYGKGLL